MGWLAAFGQRIVAELTATRPRLTGQEAQRGIRLLLVDGMCSMAMATLQGGPFLAAFALAIGASNYEIGMLASVPFLAQPMQLVGLYLVTRFRTRRAINVLASAGSRLLWVPIILIPVLFVGQGAPFLIQCLLLSALLAALPGPAWNSLLKDLVPERLLGRVFARRIALGTALAMGLTLAGGWFIDWWNVLAPGAALFAYSLVFTAGLGFGVTGTFVVARLPERTMDRTGQAPLRELLRRPLRDRNYRSLLRFLALWNCALHMAAPFFVIYMLRRIGLSMSTVTALTVLSQLTNLLFLRVWGRIADRFSNKSVLAVSGTLFLFALPVWTFTTMPERYVLTIPLLIVIHLLSGTSMAGIVLATSNIALKLAPRGSAHAYLTVFALVGAVTGALGPLAGGLIADVFAANELSLSVNWSDPTRHLSVYALNIRALDFVFLFAFLVGLVAVNQLAAVREEGEVEEREVVDELMGAVVLPIRSVSSIEGIVRLTTMPLHRLGRVVGRRRRR